MTQRKPSNLSASVHQRLLNLSQERREEFNRLLTLFTIERFLYRLSQSPYANRFVLKGALLFMVWTKVNYRPTRDLDLLGFGDSSAITIQRLFQEICTLAVDADGLVFDAQSVQVHPIREEQEYQGQRVELIAKLGQARIHLQIDIGMGDSVSPVPVEREYPTLLEFPQPYLRMYAKESVIAEKLHAMVALDLTNSRMKDFYDLWTLAHLFAFDGIILTRAIEATFVQRKTQLPTTPPTALTAVFAEHPAKLAQWQAFLRRNELTVDGASFAQIIADLRTFLWPPLQALTTQIPFAAMWTPQTQWHEQA